ncbi:MAG: CDP-diacylglycerol--serine O-phosphatidyltransferase [Tidjanibacter sp.]|nr:CDP-diacylglycerol--serine O-phosphatidyltransferase [Tidjanibacter sp.]
MKVKYFTLPNIITLGNLACGTMAALCAVSSIWSPETVSLKVPLLLILLSALLDFCDGLAARLTGQYSALGVQLDSLADMVSFGLTPSLVLVAMFEKAGGVGAWWLVALAVVLCSALRLARFNIDEEQKEEFIGLPTPACAIAIGSLAWAVEEGVFVLSPSVILAVAIVFAWLLISPIRMFSLKFKGFSLKTPANRLRYVFLLVAAVVIIIGGLSAAWAVIALYILISLIRTLTAGCHCCCHRREK